MVNEVELYEDIANTVGEHRQFIGKYNIYDE